MDVVLGVAVTGRVARLAMIGSSDSSGQVFDQYALDLPDDATSDLAETIVGTYRAVADRATGWPRHGSACPTRQKPTPCARTVSNAGVQDVEVVAETEAAAALARSAGADAALLLADDDTVALAVVGEDEESTSVLASMPIGSAGAAVACAAVLEGRCRSAHHPGHVRAGSAWTSIRLRPSSVRRCRWRCRRSGLRDRARSRADGRSCRVRPGGRGDADGARGRLAPVGRRDGAGFGRDADGAGRRCDADGDGFGRGGSWAAAGLLAGRAGLLRDAIESARGVDPEQADEATLHRGDRAATAKNTAVGSAMAFLVMSFTTLAVTVAINIRPVADVGSDSRYRPCSRIRCRGATCRRCRTSRIRWRCRSRWCRRRPPLRRLRVSGSTKGRCPITCPWRRRRCSPGRCLRFRRFRRSRFPRPLSRHGTLSPCQHGRGRLTHRRRARRLPRRPRPRRRRQRRRRRPSTIDAHDAAAARARPILKPKPEPEPAPGARLQATCYRA